MLGRGKPSAKHMKVAEESSIVIFPLYDSFSKTGSTVLSRRKSTWLSSRIACGGSLVNPIRR